MKLHKQYLQLQQRYGMEESDVTLDELAELLLCTHRNVVLLLGRMVKRNWAAWQPRRGRGNRSKLQLFVEPEEIWLQIVQDAVTLNEIKAAIEQIRLMNPSHVMQERLERWLLSSFGHRSLMRNERKLDTLQLPVRQSLQTLDPLQMNLLAESFVTSHVFDSLVRLNERTEVLPHLAHAWECNEQRTRWTFYLRKGITFHNGAELTSSDVVYTLERLLHSNRRILYRSVFKQIQQIQATDAWTLHISLKEANALFLPFLATSRAAIVPNQLAMLSPELFATQPIGSGPFKVIEFEEKMCALEAYPHYFAGRAHLDRVNIWSFPAGAEPAKLEHAESFPIMHHAVKGEEQDGEWSQLQTDTYVCKFLTFNSKKDGPMSVPASRAAVHCALEGQPVISTFDGLSLLIATIPAYEFDAGQVASKLSVAGFSPQIRLISPEEFKGTARMEADLILFARIRDRDEQLRLYDLYETMMEHVQPHTRVDIETQLRKVAREPSAALRETLFQELEQRLLGEHLMVNLYERPVHTAFLPSVRGMAFNSQGWIDLRSIWFKT